jgi:hypothetical protein
MVFVMSKANITIGSILVLNGDHIEIDTPENAAKIGALLDRHAKRKVDFTFRSYEDREAAEYKTDKGAHSEVRVSVEFSKKIADYVEPELELEPSVSRDEPETEPGV